MRMRQLTFCQPLKIEDSVSSTMRPKLQIRHCNFFGIRGKITKRIESMGEESCWGSDRILELDMKSNDAIF